jgi:hypothetical protein
VVSFVSAATLFTLKEAPVSQNRRVGRPHSQFWHCGIEPQFLGHTAHSLVTILTILHQKKPNNASLNIYKKSLGISVNAAALHLAVRGLSIVSLQWNSVYYVFSFYNTHNTIRLRSQSLKFYCFVCKLLLCTGSSHFMWFCFNATWKFTPLFEFKQ